MALMDLVLRGRQDNYTQEKISQEYHTLQSTEPIQWNSHLQFPIPRGSVAGDLLQQFQLSVKVGSAPEGYRWKRCWPLYFVKKFEIFIGNFRFFSIKSETLCMKYLMDGLRTYPAWQTSKDTIISTEPECLFDLSEEERTQRSSAPHEILFEPLSLEESIHSYIKIPAVALSYHDIEIHLQTGAIEDCLEPITQEHNALPEDTNSILQQCTVLALNTFLDREERRRIATSDLEFQTKHLTHCSTNISKPEIENHLKLSIEQVSLSSAAYIWITDENDNELPVQVLDKLEVKFNSHIRHSLTGFESRMSMGHHLPHPVTQNTKSKNLYYISYYPGRKEENGLEQGVNFSRLDNYSILLYFSQNAPQNMKIHIVHRAQNVLRIKNGLAGLVYDLPSNTIQVNTLPTIPFTDEPIPISPDEPMCMIAYENFKEGDIVQQCLTCRKIFNSNALNQWFISQILNQNNQIIRSKCVHCQSDYLNSFRKGRATLVAAAAAPAALLGPVPAQQQA